MCPLRPQNSPSRICCTVHTPSSAVTLKCWYPKLPWTCPLTATEPTACLGRDVLIRCVWQCVVVCLCCSGVTWKRSGFSLFGRIPEEHMLSLPYDRYADFALHSGTTSGLGASKQTRRRYDWQHDITGLCCKRNFTFQKLGNAGDWDAQGTKKRDCGGCVRLVDNRLGARTSIWVLPRGIVGCEAILREARPMNDLMT